MEPENAFSHSFSVERRLKFLTRKLEEITTVIQLPMLEAGPKIEMFFHKLRGTAATFDFMDLDTIAQKAQEAKGDSAEMLNILRECRTLVESHIALLKIN